MNIETWQMRSHQHYHPDFHYCDAGRIADKPN